MNSTDCGEISSEAQDTVHRWESSEACCGDITADTAHVELNLEKTFDAYERRTKIKQEGRATMKTFIQKLVSKEQLKGIFATVKLIGCVYF